MMGKVALTFMIVALCQLAVAQDDDCYTVSSFVGEEPDLAADVCAINAALDKSTPDYKTAMDIYENGQLERTVTLKQIATGEYPTETYQKYAVYFEDDKWMDTLINNAFIRRTPFTTDVKRVQMIKKLLQASVLVQQVFFHIDSAIVKAEVGNSAGALTNWGKAMSVYYGAETQCSPFGNGQSRGIEFDTMNDGGVAEANSAVHGAFLKGGEALESDDSTAQDIFKTLTDARKEIVKQITIIYAQAVFKYATLVDEGLEEDKDVEKAQAEGFAYYHAIVPLVAEVDEDAAASILEAFDIANDPDEELAEQVKPTMSDVFSDLDIADDEVKDFDSTRKAAYVVPAETSCRLDNQFSDDAEGPPKVDR